MIHKACSATILRTMRSLSMHTDWPELHFEVDQFINFRVLTRRRLNEADHMFYKYLQIQPKSMFFMKHFVNHCYYFLVSG